MRSNDCSPISITVISVCFSRCRTVGPLTSCFRSCPSIVCSEKPTRNAIIADITCDCDGKIDRFVDRFGAKRFLPLHELKESEEYYLGVFLVGAYQETLGDLHNLLGDTNVVTVSLHEDGKYDFSGELEGDTVADILSYVEYDPKRLLMKFRKTAETAVKEGRDFTP